MVLLKIQPLKFLRNFKVALPRTAEQKKMAQSSKSEPPTSIIILLANQGILPPLLRSLIVMPYHQKSVPQNLG